jgi:hypothetical protein
MLALLALIKQRLTVVDSFYFISLSMRETGQLLAAATISPIIPAPEERWR